MTGNTTPHTLRASAHLASFGASRLFGAHAPLHYPEPEEGGEGGERKTRAEWVREEKAKHLDKSVEVLADKIAGLQYDLNAARANAKALLPEGHVAVPKEDAAALAAYREAFPTPKEAGAAKKALGESEERDALAAYDRKRAELLDAHKDLPDAYRNLVLTGEELVKRHGGREALRDLDLLEADVKRYAAAFGATVEDPKEKDVGVPPAGTGKGTGSGSTQTEAQTAAGMYRQRTGLEPVKGE